MKTILRLTTAVSLLLAATSSYAWFGNNNGWGGDYNPYDEWDPRYWMEEMENAFDDDDYYGPPPGYYGGPGPYGPPPGYYGPPPGYAPPPPPQYNGPNAGPRNYGPPPGYRQGPPPGYRGPAPQQAPQQAPPQQR